MTEIFEIDIERGKIREFARATMSRNPAYLEGRSPVSPATYLMTTAFWGGGITKVMDDQAREIETLKQVVKEMGAREEARLVAASRA
jgi:hypothetical protein